MEVDVHCQQLYARDIQATNAKVSQITCVNPSNNVNSILINRFAESVGGVLAFQTDSISNWLVGFPLVEGKSLNIVQGSNVAGIPIRIYADSRLAVNASGGGVTRNTTVTTNAAAAPLVVTAANLIGGIISYTGGGGGQLQLPTAASLIAALTNCFAGETLDVLFSNSGGGTMTVTATGAGSTVVGNAAVLTLTSRYMRVRITDTGTGTEAYTVYL
jgi:hypothetical protein